MTTPTKTLIDLETKFWQSMVDQDADAALQLLHDPALMASGHGAMKFDHAGYRKMAEQGAMVVTSFAFRDVEVMFPTATTAVMTYRVKQTVAARDGGKSTTEDMSVRPAYRIADGSEASKAMKHRACQQQALEPNYTIELTLLFFAVSKIKSPYGSKAIADFVDQHVK